MSRREFVVVVTAAVALSGALLLPWLREAASAIPDAAREGNPWWGADARLILWILAWDAHALWTQPLGLFDANIFHPLPGTLAGSEHLLASVLLSGPIQALTGNPVLAANTVALASYPLSAVLIYALLRALALGPAAACVGSVAFALGPLRVPADLHVLQYPNHALAFALLTLLAVGRGLSAWLALPALVAALFTSYYIAVMTAALVAVEVAIVALRGSVAIALRLVAAAAAAALLLLLCSRPYFGLASSTALTANLSALGAVAPVLRADFLDPGNRDWGCGWGVAILALAGLAAPLLGARAPAERWWRWVALAAVGGALAWGPTLEVGGLEIPMPAAILAETPLRALRGLSRFVILAHVGVAGLAAEGAAAMLASARAHGAGSTTAALLGGALAVAAGLPRALDLTARPLTALRTGDAVPAVDRWLATAAGPLLEIPGPGLGTALEQSESMYSSTFHWRPLLNGHTGFVPWQFEPIAAEIRRLPDPRALRAVVDLTGMRWILVRRSRVDAATFARWGRAAESSEALTLRPEGGNDLLLEVGLRARRPWADVLAAGGAGPGRTTLGTPLAPLSPRLVSGTIRAVLLTRTAPAGRRLRPIVTVENRGVQDWPALVRPGESPAQTVVVTPRWTPRDGGPALVREPIPLPRDIATDDAVVFQATVVAPERPGAYTLDLALEQLGGPHLPGVEPARLGLDVASAAE
jgi:hypothetical protein